MQPLDKYFDGENVEGKELNLTTPLSIGFTPTVGKAGEFNGTTKDFNVSYLIPAADAVRPNSMTYILWHDCMTFPLRYSQLDACECTE
jgi:hypothetical protein